MTTPAGTSSVHKEHTAEQHAGKSQFSISSQENRLRRIERIAIRLFGVANCVISFGQAAARFGKGERSMAALEATFCDSLAFPHDPVIVSDARSDPKTAANPWVVGPPYVRFYAAQPIINDNKVVGAIFLIDYVARQFQEEDTFLLNDLADLVKQELMLGSLHSGYEEIVRQNRSLRRESMLDPMLGTWNRSAIIRSLEIELLRSHAVDKPMSLAMVSVDNYDVLKNECGFRESESILIKMVSRLRSCIRPFDALGRFGTEEFLVVLPGVSQVVIQAITERMRSTVFANPESVNDKTVNATISIGTVSTDIFTSANPDELMTLVEQALHTAKKTGANRVVHAKADETL